MPELDGKANEVRHFCPLLPLPECLCKAKRGLHENSVNEKAVYKVAKYCSQIYTCLGHGSLPELEKAVRDFCEPVHGFGNWSYFCGWILSEAADIQTQVPFDQPHAGSSGFGARPKGLMELPTWKITGCMQKLSFRSPGKFEPGMAAENFLLRWMADTPKAAGIRMLQEAWTDSSPRKNTDNMEKKIEKVAAIFCCLMDGSQIISFKALPGRNACLKKAIVWPAASPKLVKAMGNPLEIYFLWICMVMVCLCQAEMNQSSLMFGHWMYLGLKTSIS